MTQNKWSRRLTFFGLAIGIGLPALTRFSAEEHLIANRSALTGAAVIVGALCLLGAYLAYRSTAEQVKADRKEIGLDG